MNNHTKTGKHVVIYLMSLMLLAAGCGKKEPVQDTQAAAAPPAEATPTAEAAPGGGVSQQAIDDLCYQVRYSDDPDKVAKLLEGGISPNVRGSKGFTALVTALQYGAGGTDEMQERMVDVLLSHGADVNADNGAALLEIAGSGKAGLAGKLLDKGAGANVADSLGRTPLMLAAGSQSQEMTSLLLDKGADPNMKDNAGHNAWYIAFGNAYSFRTEKAIKVEELLRGRTNRSDMEALLRADTSLHGYFDVDKWLQEHP